MYGCLCEMWCWNKSIHTSRGSPPVSLDDDRRSPTASTDSLLVVVNEFLSGYSKETPKKGEMENNL
jgi:hypothetical protein